MSVDPNVGIDTDHLPRPFMSSLADPLPDGVALQKYVEAIQDLGLERIGNGRDLRACAGLPACQNGLGGYDAVYTATAQLTDGCWSTADIRLIERSDTSR